jgi:iron complex transport system substrate-binding protein
MTEILFAAGLGDKVIGVTNFCDYPEEAEKKPKIGGMSNPSLETVVSLKPDIVVMTTDGNPKEFQQRLSSMKIKTYVFEAVTLSELPAGIRKMGIALDAKERFDSLAAEMEQAINKYKDKGQGTRDKGQKKVLFIIWPEPLIAAGPQTAVDDAINLLGWSNIAGKAKGRYPKFSIEEIIRQSPDIIFFGRGKGMDEISGRLLKRLSSVPAVKNKKVFYVSDNLYRLGPRVIKGIEELEGYLQRKP